MRPSRVTAVVSYLLLAARGSAAPLDVDALAKRDWVEVRTPHFRLLTDAPENSASGLGVRLEQFSEFLHVVHPGLRNRPVLPVDVYVFRDLEDMRAFSPTTLENVQGFATTTIGRNVFVMNAGGEGPDRDHVLCHEYTHLFLNANFSGLPIFLNEGLAEYYETFRPRGDRAEFAHRQEWMQQWLAQHAYVDLDLLFAMNTQAPAYQRDNELRTTTYAEGWAIVHYLLAKPDRAVKFDSVLAQLRAGVPDRIAFRTQFPSDGWPALVASVKQYVTDAMFDVRTMPMRAGLDAPPSRGAAVTPAEALARLGDLVLALGSDRLDDAARLYTGALARDSALAQAWAAAGFVADAQGDSSRAEPLYRRAEAEAPDDPHVALLTGDGALERVRHLLKDDRISRSRVHELLVAARSRYARCLRGDENNPEALAGLGNTYIVELRMPDVAYHALALAKDELPGRTDVAAQFRYATELRQKVSSDTGAPDSTRGASAQDSPADAAEFDRLVGQSDEAIHDGRYADAIALLRRLRAMAAAPGVGDAQALDERIARCRLASGLDRVREALVARRFAAAQDTIAALRPFVTQDDDRRTLERASTRARVGLALGRADRLLRAGDRKGARAELARALESTTDDDELRAFLQKSLAQLDHPAPTR